MEMLIAVAKIWVYFLYVVCAVGIRLMVGERLGGRLGGREVKGQEIWKLGMDKGQLRL